MRRALVHVLLLGVLTGIVAGIAVFGLPLPAEDVAPAPHPLTRILLGWGLGLHESAIIAGGLALLLLALIVVLDLRRHARHRRS